MDGTTRGWDLLRLPIPVRKRDGGFDARSTGIGLVILFSRVKKTDALLTEAEAPESIKTVSLGDSVMSISCNCTCIGVWFDVLGCTTLAVICLTSSLPD